MLIAFASPTSFGSWALLPISILIIGVLAPLSVFLLAIRVRKTILASRFPVGTPIDRQDRRYWKNGFYVNPQDPALWVARPLGRTINVGHPKGLLVLGTILAGVFLLALGPLLLVLLALR